jgi:poly(beta-D-mannuronate) lyase
VTRFPAFITISALLCFMLYSAQAKASQPALASPWDTHTVALTDAAYDCPTLAAMPHDIVAYDYYSDAKHSIIDPTRHAAYQAASKPYGDVEAAVVRAADNFQQTGSRAAAACVAHILSAQAQANSMTGSMSSNQAYYVQGWALGAVAIGWLKVRPAGNAALGLTPEQTTALTAWLKTVGGQVEDYFNGMHEKNASTGRNNHYYWAGFSVMAAGIAANDRAQYEWGIGTYKVGVDQIQPDGTLPLEMGRGQRALHYHLFAAAPLVTIAELAEANGDNLYAYDQSRLALLVARCVAGLDDNHFFVEKSGVAQDTPSPDGTINGSDISWLPPYASRFPSPEITAQLKRVEVRGETYLGGMPPP